MVPHRGVLRFTANTADLVLWRDEGGDWMERRVVWKWKSTLSDTITLPKGTTSSPSAPACALTMTFIHAAMSKAQARRPCLNTNHLTGSSQRLHWNEAVIRAMVLSLCVTLRGEIYVLFSLLFSTAPVVGSADLKRWWSSDSSNWAQRYIFIILQSAPKTLSLVFKPLDGKLQLQSRTGTYRLVILNTDCSAACQASICFDSAIWFWDSRRSFPMLLQKFQQEILRKWHVHKTPDNRKCSGNITQD